jgi:uncharacterized protein YneF (UPF0154 family)
MQYQGSAKASLRWSLFPKGKRGVTNIVLMLGVAMCIAILLIGGFLLVTKLVEAQARSSPEYLATELVTLINTVQTAPETITFNYYTETDVNGFPVIGSLEIDDSKNLLCIHPKTEDEIFGSIADQAAVGAGFGAVGYVPNRIRSAVAARAASKAAQYKAIFGDMSSIGLDEKMLYRAGSDTEEGLILRKYLANPQSLSKTEGKTLQKLVTKDEMRQLRTAQKVVSNNPALAKGLEASVEKPDSLSERIMAKIPYTDEKKVATLGEQVMVQMEKAGENPSLWERTKGALKATAKAPGQIIFMGGTLFATYMLTGGDWQTTSLVAVQLVGYRYAYKFVGWIAEKVVAKFGTSLAAAVPPTVVAATAYKTFGEICKDDPDPISKPVICATAGIAKAAEVLTNIVFSAYNTILLDTQLLTILSASSHQVAVERNALACKTFEAPKQVLLTPPNCNPEVKYGAAFQNYQAIGAGTFWTTAGALWVATYWSFTTAFIPSASNIPQIEAYGALAAGMTPAYGSLAATLIQDPTGLIPKSGCNPNSCDTKYLRQDCPNWFLAQTGLTSQVSGSYFSTMLEGGPVCAAMALTGMAGTLCNAARFTTGMAIFLTAPSEVFNFFLQGYAVGLNKPEIKSKTAPEFPNLTNEFSDNQGFWYAELPYTIEITKVYTNETTLGSRNPPIIIKKV